MFRLCIGMAAVGWALSVRCGLGLGGAVFGVWCWCGSVPGLLKPREVHAYVCQFRSVFQGLIVLILVNYVGVLFWMFLGILSL